jgi:hypothetical protein
MAINPFALLGNALNYKGADQFVHGIFSYDPIQLQKKQSNPRPITFILNYLSYYCDLAVHGLLEEYQSPTTWHEFWCIGCHGPFGYFYHDNMKELKHQMDNLLPPSQQAKITNEGEQTLHQSDDYNCGMYCVMFIRDFVMTQWKKSYHLIDFTGSTKIEESGQITYKVSEDYALGKECIFV